MLDSHNIPVNVLYRNCLYATLFESHADNPKLKQPKLCHISS